MRIILATVPGPIPKYRAAPRGSSLPHSPLAEPAHTDPRPSSPPPSARTRPERLSSTDALLRRRGRTVRPLLVRDFCAAAYNSGPEAGQDKEEGHQRGRGRPGGSRNKNPGNSHLSGRHFFRSFGIFPEFYRAPRGFSGGGSASYASRCDALCALPNLCNDKDSRPHPASCGRFARTRRRKNASPDASSARRANPRLATAATSLRRARIERDARSEWRRKRA
jgi:hypothetical protein